MYIWDAGAIFSNQSNVLKLNRVNCIQLKFRLIQPKCNHLDRKLRFHIATNACSSFFIHSNLFDHLTDTGEWHTHTSATLRYWRVADEFTHTSATLR